MIDKDMKIGHNSHMHRLQMIDEKLYDAVMDIESSIAIARVLLFDKRDSQRALNIMHTAFPELVESDLPLLTKIADAIESVDQVKAYLMAGDKVTARRIFKGQFPSSSLKT
jgi:hypothetical protein